MGKELAGRRYSFKSAWVGAHNSMNPLTAAPLAQVFTTASYVVLKLAAQRDLVPQERNAALVSTAFGENRRNR
ncbi:MAG: hypothetical protein JW741_28190 [Sedimentisphaerales bacterium]|nr:hypothetical protein [Sedimentisphaerales bacterium]